MNIKEVIERVVHDNIVPPPPSATWESYVQNIRNGNEENVPVYGQGSRIIFDYYGVSKKSGFEQGRIRIPLQGNKLEISYHITQKPDKTFQTIHEGIFPYAG
nr:hypothetical protein [Candidatus Levybacteria bacterium]